MGEVIAECVACVSAQAIRFVEFRCGLAKRIDGPADAFEIGDQFFAARVNEEAHFASGTQQPLLTVFTRSRTPGFDVAAWM